MTGRGFSTKQTLQDGALAVGNGAVLNVAGLAWVGVEVSIETTATVRFEVTINGQEWRALPLTLVADGSSADHAAASGAYRGSVAGLAQFRARLSEWSAGAVTVKALGSVLPN